VIERHDPVASRLRKGITLELVVEDHDMVEALEPLPEGPARNVLALDALRIGLLALRQARGQMDTDGVRRECDRFLALLRGTLESHGDTIRDRVRGTLGEYFDPISGKFSERVERLVREDGEIEALIRRQVEDLNQGVSETLFKHVGEASPLLRALDPAQGNGVVASLRALVESALLDHRKTILGEFSLDRDGSALNRLVGEIRRKQEQLGGDVKDCVETLRQEFSLDTEGSALNRLVHRVENAQRTISREFSLDAEGSALARMKGQLLEVFERQAKENSAFQAEVRATLAALHARRQEAARSTTHGLDFEQAVWRSVERLARATGDVPKATGNTTGAVSYCKKGDCTVELGPEKIAAGAVIVFEAKQENGWDLPKARKEIEEARKNRKAQIGVFVLSRRCAPEGAPPFQRYGDDLFIVWDPEDGATEVWLQAAMTVATALCCKSASKEVRAADFSAIEAAITELERQSKNLTEVETSAKTIANGASTILHRVGIVRECFSSQLKELRDLVAGVRGAFQPDGA
jgi:hypothetical protein